jgi:DNA-binding response OmpR family regulator
LPQRRRILICDDDPDLRAALLEQLSLHEEFEVRAARTAGEAVAATAERAAPDLVLMDIGLPDMDGREAVRKMRANGFRAPVLMLTAQDSDDDTVLGLDAGANDYIAKPFRFAVLLARIRAQLRQHESSDEATFDIGGYVFKPSAKTLFDADGSELKLTEKETAILRYLHRAGGQTVPRETLLKEVWGYSDGVSTHTLETHIYRLRQKIERDPARAAILLTEAGGYRLAG